MSDEIYVNTGGTFQQPFNDRQPSNAQQPYIANGQQPYIANAQQPFTYQNRAPSSYRHPASAQQPYIANAQQPYPYIANARQPYIANAQQPYPYIANAQSPYIANARQPSEYRNPVNGQQPYIAQARQPAEYQARYPADSQTPYIADGQQPFTYQARYPANYTYPANAQNPFTYNARQPAIYQHPFTYNHSTPANSSTPVIYDVFGGGSSSTANIETTTDISGPMAPFNLILNTDLGMSANEWWGANSPHMKNNPNSAFAPSNPYYPSNPMAGGLGTYYWETSQSNTFQYSFGQCWAYFAIGYFSSTHSIYYMYAGGDSTAAVTPYGYNPNYIKMPLTELANGIIDSTWNIDVKYTVQQQGSNGGSNETQTPANAYYGVQYAAGTYYSIWNTASSNYRQFQWLADSSSNYGQSSGSANAQGLVFTIRASKSGQTTYYSHFIAQNGIMGGGAGFGQDIYLRSTYGTNRQAL